MRKLYAIIILIGYAVVSVAQQHFSFVHYTSDQGLSQNSVTAMHKDQKGFLWVCTRDGLNRFDGKTFRSYNYLFNRKYAGSSNRFLDIREDRSGNLWLKAYDDYIYCLVNQTDEFIRPQDENGKEIGDKIKSYYVLPGGSTWLATIKSGCYKVDFNPENGTLKSTCFSKSNNKLPSDIVHKVFQDKLNTTWVLTQEGALCISPNGKSGIKLPKVSLFSIGEDNDRLVLGSQGKLYLFNKKTNSFKSVTLPVNCRITDIKVIYPNFYVLTTSGMGFLTYNAVKNEIQHFTHHQYPGLITDDILQTYVDKAGDVWFGVKAGGVVRYHTQSNKVEFFATETTGEKTTNPNMLFEEDEGNILWVQAYYGSFSWYDRSKNQLTPFRSLYNDDINIFLRYGVNHVIADNQGVLWLSTNRGNGVFKCTFLPEYFQHLLPDKKSVYNISNEVRALLETTDKKLWVATKDGKVHIYDQHKNQLGILDKNGSIRNDASTYFLVYDLFQEKNGDIWMLTRQQGLFHLTKNGNSYKITNYTESDDNYSPYSNDYYSIAQDKSGRLWVGSYGGGLQLLRKSNTGYQFVSFKNELKNYPFENCSKVRHVFVDSDNTVWVATTEGFVYFDANEKDIRKIKFNHYRNIQNESKGIATNDIHFFAEDTEKNIWIATFGGGFAKIKNKKVKPESLEFEKFEAKSGLPGNIYYTIVDDKQGSMWLTTENSIVRLNKQHKTFEVFGKGNEIENVEFSEAASVLLSSGEICIGSKSGFYLFNPLEVNRKVINAPLVFTGLRVLNKVVEIGSDNVLPRKLDLLDRIEFTHKQNVFTVEFAALDMRAPEKIQYAYMLEGFDADWNNVGDRGMATYTSLAPGDYVFRVKSTDSEGVWVNNERSINITVLPSFWQSIYAKILYLILFVAVFIISLKIGITIFTLKNTVELEKEMADVKLRFFTDISHELRTPLTLISLPVDNVLKENIDPHVKEQMKFIRVNLDKVISLINQILDFRKLQNNKMNLFVTEINFGEFVEKCTDNFVELANSKNIELLTRNNSGSSTVWADAERLESIIQNLLSNAMKYTPSGKTILVVTENKGDSLVLKVSDEGVGIPQEKLNSIFERFFSFSSLNNFTQKSTGIGLDLVKKITELHHAGVQVESKIGEGTTFTVSFKKGIQHFENDLYVSFKKPESVLESKINYPEPELLANEDTLNPLILVVEDNDELRNYLCSSLKNNYRVAEAINGKKAWKKIETIQPDIIITDLRMPEMDGLELIKMIRDDNRTSHIPVILLTAVTDNESKLEGMKIGVDDYITKPFNGEFLLARIQNLLNQRKFLQQYYRSQIGGFIVPTENNIKTGKDTENEFMKKLIQLMNDNMDNSELTIDTLSSEFNMSRTIFFTKLKSLTGLSPVEFIRESRLHRAADILLKSDISVSEVAYNIGIEDPRYFSRIFKSRFGDTPSEFRNKHTKQ